VNTHVNNTVDVSNSMKKLGAVPWIKKNNIIHMLFMISGPTSAIGHQPQIVNSSRVQGESAYYTAVRAAKEELGLRSSNIVNTLPGAVTELIDKDTSRYLLTVYVLKVADFDNFDQPQDQTVSTHWLSLQDFVDCGTTNQVSLVKKIHAAIQQSQ
jgi:hypothetical protein